MAPSSTLVNKIKVQLKLSVSRLRMVQAKDAALAKKQRRDMAQLLEQGRDERAKIRVENIIRSDMNTELLEILELYCELLTARAGLLEQKECDPGLEEAVKSIIYAAPKVEGVKELSTVRQLLAEKYGKDFAIEASENRDGKVAKRVADRLKVEPPSKELVEAYLSTIAEAYGIDWPPGSAAKRRAEEAGDDEDEDDEPSGGQKIKALEAPLEAEELSRATPPRDLGPKSPVSVVPPSPSTDNVRPRINLPGPPNLKPSKKMVDATTAKAKDINGEKKSDGPGGKIPDVDELTKRFAQLKSETKQRTAFGLVCAVTDTLSAMLATNALFHRDKYEYKDGADAHTILKEHRETFGYLRCAVWSLLKRLRLLDLPSTTANPDDLRDPVEVDHDLERLRRLRIVMRQCDELMKAFMQCHGVHFPSTSWFEGPDLRDLCRKTNALRAVLAPMRGDRDEPLMWDPQLED